jgi:hypothetical protein
MQLNELAGAALAFVVIGLVIAFGAMIAADVQATVETDYGDSVANDTLTNVLEALSNFGGWLPLLALVIIAVVIIGFLIGGFGGITRSA